MKVKDLQKFFTNKLIEIEKELGKDSDVYNLSYTNNGHQWTRIMRGSLKDCKIIAKAYQKCNYKLVGKIAVLTERSKE